MVGGKRDVLPRLDLQSVAANADGDAHEPVPLATADVSQTTICADSTSDQYRLAWPPAKTVSGAAPQGRRSAPNSANRPATVAVLSQSHRCQASPRIASCPSHLRPSGRHTSAASPCRQRRQPWPIAADPSRRSPKSLVRSVRCCSRVESLGDRQIPSNRKPASTRHHCDGPA